MSHQLHFRLSLKTSFRNSAEKNNSEHKRTSKKEKYERMESFEKNKNCATNLFLIKKKKLYTKTDWVHHHPATVQNE